PYTTLFRPARHLRRLAALVRVIRGRRCGVSRAPPRPRTTRAAGCRAADSAYGLEPARVRAERPLVARHPSRRLRVLRSQLLRPRQRGDARAVYLRQLLLRHRSTRERLWRPVPPGKVCERRLAVVA